MKVINIAHNIYICFLWFKHEKTNTQVSYEENYR